MMWQKDNVFWLFGTNHKEQHKFQMLLAEPLDFEW